MTPTDAFAAYITHLLGYVDPARLKPLKVVVNAGNGCAGRCWTYWSRTCPSG